MATETHPTKTNIGGSWSTNSFVLLYVNSQEVKSAIHFLNYYLLLTYLSHSWSSLKNLVSTLMQTIRFVINVLNME